VVEKEEREEDREWGVDEGGVERESGG